MSADYLKVRKGPRGSKEGDVQQGHGHAQLDGRKRKKMEKHLAEQNAPFEQGPLEAVNAAVTTEPLKKKKKKRRKEKKSVGDAPELSSKSTLEKGSVLLGSSGKEADNLQQPNDPQCNEAVPRPKKKRKGDKGAVIVSAPFELGSPNHVAAFANGEPLNNQERMGSRGGEVAGTGPGPTGMLLEVTGMQAERRVGTDEAAAEPRPDEQRVTGKAPKKHKKKKFKRFSEGVGRGGADEPGGDFHARDADNNGYDQHSQATRAAGTGDVLTNEPPKKHKKKKLKRTSELLGTGVGVEPAQTFSATAADDRGHDMPYHATGAGGDTGHHEARKKRKKKDRKHATEAPASATGEKISRDEVATEAPSGGEVYGPGIEGMSGEIAKKRKKKRARTAVEAPADETREQETGTPLGMESPGVSIVGKTRKEEKKQGAERATALPDPALGDAEVQENGKDDPGAILALEAEPAGDSAAPVPRANGAAAAQTNITQKGVASAAGEPGQGTGGNPLDDEKTSPFGGTTNQQSASKTGGAAQSGPSKPQQSKQGPSVPLREVTSARPAAPGKPRVESTPSKEQKNGPFTDAERKTIMASLKEYASLHGLDASDLSWALNTRSHKGAKGAWMHVTNALPHRSFRSVHGCGVRMLHEGNYQGKWSKEDTDRLLELVAEKGRQWTEIGQVLGRMSDACRDRYRNIKLQGNQRTGHWTTEEEDTLRKLVQSVIKRKQEALRSSGHVPKHPPLPHRDGIDWEHVGDMMGTRSCLQCRRKWYYELRPTMVDEGLWDARDDMKLLKALQDSGAAFDHEVDWGKLVAGRGAVEAQTRWKLMLKHLKGWRSMEFPDIVSHLMELAKEDLENLGIGEDSE